MRRHIQAWIDYDAGALMETSVRPSEIATQAWLSHLARAKLSGSQLRLLDTRVQYLAKDVAVVEADLEDRGAAELVSYVLVYEEGVWKVAGRARVADREPEEAGPLRGRFS